MSWLLARTVGRAECSIRLLLALLCTIPCSSFATANPSAPRSRRDKQKTAADYHFDGFKLGDRFSGVHVAVGARRVFSNANLGYEKPQFHRSETHLWGLGHSLERPDGPDGTSMVFLLRYADTDAEGPSQPIEAFAWMGGTYFNTRSDFPLHAGDPVSRAEAALGPVIARFRVDSLDKMRWNDRSSPGLEAFISSKQTNGDALALMDSSAPFQEDSLIVTRHPGDVYALADGKKLVGFVVGPMPDRAADYQWKALVETYARYTVKHRYPIGSNVLAPYLPDDLEPAGHGPVEDPRSPNALPFPQGVPFIIKVCEVLSAGIKTPEEAGIKLGLRRATGVPHGIRAFLADPSFTAMLVQSDPAYPHKHLLSAGAHRSGSGAWIAKLGTVAIEKPPTPARALPWSMVREALEPRDGVIRGREVDFSLTLGSGARCDVQARFRPAEGNDKDPLIDEVDVLFAVPGRNKRSE